MGRLTTAVAALACAGAFAVLASGCGERHEPTGTTVPMAYPVTVQGANEVPLEIARAPQRVLPVSATAAALVDALGLRALVPGAPASGRLRAFPLGAIRATAADLVVGSQSNDFNALQAAAVTANVPLLILADSSIRDLEHSILELGLAIGAPLQARTLVAAMNAKRAVVKARLKGLPPVTVFVDTGYFIPVVGSGFAGEVLREAGGENIAAAAEASPFPIKDLLTADPTMYLATVASGTTLADLRKTRRVRNLAAIREGRFATIPLALLQPGPDVGEAIDQLSLILHPAP